MARLTGYFLDTYPIVEFLAGNGKLEKYFESDELATSIMNLVELYYYVVSRKGEREAGDAYVAFKVFQREITGEDVARGMALRLRMKARNLDFSFADAVGYAMSMRLGIRFLTGDTAFRNLPNVEYTR